jgi:hypothetical protein
MILQRNLLNVIFDDVATPLSDQTDIDSLTPK